MAGRQLKPRRRQTRGQRNIAWIERYCRVPEGKDVGRPLRLRPFQKKVLRKIYDTPTRQAIISFARKNGKTALAAALTLLHLAGPEARKNSQLYSDAQSREQAAIVFALAAKMIRLNPDLADCIVIRESAKVLECAELGTIYRALSAEASTAYGFSPVFVIHDELGQVEGPRSELYEALETAMGAHDDPLSIVISTQARQDGDLLSTLIDSGLTGGDPRTKVFLFTVPPDADAWNSKSWRLANPALGEFRSLADVRDQAQKARKLPALESSFRNLILNQRVAADPPFVSEAVWKECGGRVDREELEGLSSWLGIDLGMEHDQTALVLVTPLPDGRVWTEPFVFIPEDGIRERAEKDKVPYDLWARSGALITMPGRTTNFRIVAEKVIELAGERNVVECLIDPYRLQYLVKPLEELLTEKADADTAGDETSGTRVGNVLMIEFRQGFVSMGPAVSALERLVIDRKLRHGNHPVLAWEAQNVRVRIDDAGNKKFSKAKSRGRIDAMVSLLMGVARAQVAEVAGPSVYETRGLTTL